MTLLSCLSVERRSNLFWEVYQSTWGQSSTQKEKKRVDREKKFDG
jgi:hypothetical protein